MEFKKFVIDSNIFVAFYYQDDESHKQALEILKDLDDKLLIVHPYVIQETATVLAYKLGQAAAVQFLSDVKTAENILIPAVNVKEDIQSFIEVGKKLSFTDTALIALAQ